METAKRVFLVFCEKTLPSLILSYDRKSMFIDEAQELPKVQLLSSLRLGLSQLAKLKLTRLSGQALSLFPQFSVISEFDPHSSHKLKCYCLLVRV